MLALPIYLSFAGALLLLLLPAGNARAARIVALLTAAAGLAVTLGVAVTWQPVGRVVPLVKVPWIPSLGIEYHLGFDGISLTLVVLTGLAAVSGILFSWNIEHRAREFFALFLTLIGGVYGVFLSFDLFLLFVFYEIAIIPKYFLVAIWGSTRKEYGAMKLVLYSFVGSALVLIGMIAAWAVAGGQTFDIQVLARQASFTRDFQGWVFPLVFIGFGILAGLWPFHTWAPTGHVAAPTAASMLLAGVVMKLGAYGCLRVAMPLFPEGLSAWTVDSYGPHLWHSLLNHSLIENIQWALHLVGFGSWRGVFAVLAIIGIVYGALVALVQKDFKFVIGYSSVSHMGFVILGLMTLNIIGLQGAVLQMFSHGVIAGLLFAVVGRMVYDRTHTRQFADLEGLGLSKAMPFAAVTFVLAGMASMGLPGFSGFVAELQVLMGAWKAFPTLTVISGLGVVIGVAYTMRAVQKGFFADAPAAATAHDHEHPMPPISAPERLAAVLLIGVSLLIGLFPSLLLNWIRPAFESPMFDRLLRGGLL